MIEALETATPYDFCNPEESVLGYWEVLFRTYVRGEAYIAAHQAGQAAAAAVSGQSSVRQIKSGKALVTLAVPLARVAENALASGSTRRARVPRDWRRPVCRKSATETSSPYFL